MSEAKAHAAPSPRASCSCVPTRRGEGWGEATTSLGPGTTFVRYVGAHVDAGRVTMLEGFTYDEEMPDLSRVVQFALAAPARDAHRR